MILPFQNTNRGKSSLIQHLTTNLIVVVVASSIAISSIIFVVLYTKSKAEFNQRANDSLSHLRSSLESPLWHMEEESIASLCSSYANNDLVVYLKVTDHRGNQLCKQEKQLDSEIIFKETNVKFDGVDVGSIQLGLTPKVFKTEVYKTTWISLLSLLSVVIIVGVFTRKILNRTLQVPLGQLISRIEEISAGKYVRKEHGESHLEIQRILSKFNEMAEQVNIRENALKVSEGKYKNIFDTAIEGIWVSDKNWKTTKVNKVMAELLGYTETEMLGKPVADLVHKDELANHAAQVDKRRLGEGARYEQRLVKKDGRTVWVIISGSPQIGDSGEFEGSFGMVTDITGLRIAEAELKKAYGEMETRVTDRTAELDKTNRLLTSEVHIRKQTEKEIIRAKEVAEAATKAKSEFLANMSHEIRTPMNAVIGMTHLVKMTNLSSTQTDYLNKIDLSARSLLGIINDILDLSKIEAGMLSVESVGFKLEQMLEQLTTIISPKASEKKLEFLINVGPDVPQNLVGDSLRLSQIMINLCNNAVKFTEEGEIVVSIETVDIDENQARLRFSVKDDGIGIQPDQINRLFEAFTQADASTTRKYGGTGLGLNLCNQLVELMGGEIGAESEFGEGSTFWLEIPFNLFHQERSSISLPADLHGMPTLVVDDNPTSRVILKGMLEQMGLSVSLAKSGFEAVEILRNTPHDQAYKLLVLDWRMPGMDGLETAKVIMGDTNISPTPPMLMVSAYGNENLIRKTQELGFKGLLFKPINQSLFFNLIIETFGRDLVTAAHLTGDGQKAEPNLSGASILLVEDNEINRQVAQEILTAAGIHVHEATNGQKALEFLEKTPVDLVLMDIQMPVMDGYEATARLREQDKFKDLPIVAMTAHAMAEDKQKSKETGMNDHISKPFDPEELFDILAKWITPDSLSKPAQSDQEKPAKEEVSLPDDIAGIDIKLGLKRARGNKKLYKNLLLLMDEKYANASGEIEQALIDDRRHDAGGIAHSVKGTSGMLGAMDLYEAAGELEQVLDSDLEMKDEESLKRFADQLAIVIEGISVLKQVSATKTDLNQEQVSDTKTLQAVLDELKLHLKEGAPVESQLAAKKIQSLGWPSEVQPNVTALLSRIAEYDFKKALVCLTEVDNAIKGQ